MLTIKIGDEGEAFQPNRIPEMVRILRDLCDRLENHGGDVSSVLRDYNGNKVGRAQFHHKNQALPENWIEEGL
jgi:hypothetical protein